ncbi:EamA family transporter [Paenibacillus thailandensis]|uniref:EamA family transporter n=1 Tax=Paenibacillus thailandensis TaxID=393250 RepID=A0ABW5QRM1_9BACL
MESYKGMLYLIGAFSLAGSSVIAASLVNGRLGVFTITAVSLLLSMICLLPFQWKETMAAVRRLTAGEWMLLACQALFGVFLFRLFLLYGLTFTSSAEAGILTGATPALTVLLARLLLREKLESYKMAGIACTVAGIILIQGFLAPESLLSMAHLWGNALVLCAAASVASFNVLSRAAAVRSAASGKETVHPLTQTTLVSSIAFFSLRRSVLV